jgi:hypothetical protein
VSFLLAAATTQSVYHGMPLYDNNTRKFLGDPTGLAKIISFVTHCRRILHLLEKPNHIFSGWSGIFGCRLGDEDLTSAKP